MQTIKLIDLIPEIKENKNITQQSIFRIIRAIPKVISKNLLEKKEVKITSFFRLGFRAVKDRIVKSVITKEVLHIPQHLKFKPTFYNDFKKFINTPKD